MLEKEDIEEAKKLFKEWDNKHMWNAPEPAFLDHSKKKAQDSLNLALYLLDKVEQTEELNGNDTVTIWIIAASYYSMFFQVEHLLGLDGKKLPKDKRQQLLQELVDLTKDYDFFWDSLDDSGLKLKLYDA
jgi:hypothetical protein